jgi:hypothetical protein
MDLDPLLDTQELQATADRWMLDRIIPSNILNF